MRVILSVSFLLASFCGSSALAHDLEFTYTIVLLRADGKFQVDVTCDLDALALGVAPGVDSEQAVRRLRALPVGELERRVEQVRDRLADLVTVSFDGVAMSIRPRLPDYGHSEEAPIPTILGLTARFRGAIPPDAERIGLRVDRLFPPVYLTVMDEAADIVAHQVLTRGDDSDPFALIPSSRTPPSRLTVARRYFRLGIWHIVPEGLDHILFVLGLFLLSTRLRPLLIQVTAFTVAHTATLALSAYGIVRLPPSVVEPLIAFSIAYVAIENLVTRELKPWRPLVVFLFGLLHGMGFAGFLGELGIPEQQFLTALVSFNLGVEAGQLSVVTAAFLTIGWFHDKSWYRARVTIPLSLGIAAMGLYWAATRL